MDLIYILLTIISGLAVLLGIYFLSTTFRKSDYTENKARLAYYMPSAIFVKPGIVLNKNGSLQSTYRFRGPDLDSSTEQGLMEQCQRLNNIIKRLGTGWTIFAEAQRVVSTQYGRNKMVNATAEMIEDELQESFNKGEHFESVYFITLVYMPASQKSGGLISKTVSLFVKDDDQNKDTLEKDIEDFERLFDKVFELMELALPECELLSDDEILTYLHSTFSSKHHVVKKPPYYLEFDHYLYDCELVGGTKPILGKSHLRAVSILNFTRESYPGILDSLNSLGFEYRWSERFICYDKVDAIKEIDSYKDKHTQTKKGGLKGLLSESILKTKLENTDPMAEINEEDAMVASLEVQDDLVGIGQFTSTIIILDEDEEQAEHKARVVEKLFNNSGFTAKVETTNSCEAFFGTIPGNTTSNIRRALVNTMNLCHFFPLSAPYAGEAKNNHLDGPPLAYTLTKGSTPFRFNIHVKDVGHTTIIGRTGSGKSVLISSIIHSFSKYKNSQIFAFDKGASARAIVTSLGGNYYKIGDRSSQLSFQPLLRIDDIREREWAAQWLENFLHGSNFVVTPTHKAKIWEALTGLAETPESHRTLTSLSVMLTDSELTQALQPLTLTGSYGSYFDSNNEVEGSGRFQLYEMEEIMKNPAVVPYVLDYLFHRIEAKLSEGGEPTLIILDECWIFLKDPHFAKQIEEWLRVLRKKNAAVVFATQNLTDITDSAIASVVTENCLTYIFLPNPGAKANEKTIATYKSFGLNDKEISNIAEAIQKRDYYYKTEHGSRLFDLNLGKTALAFMATSGTDDQVMMDRIINGFDSENHDRATFNFNYEWLMYKGLRDKAHQLLESDDAKSLFTEFELQTMSEKIA